MENLESVIIKELDNKKINNHLEYLVNNVGERLSGTEKIKIAAEYIKNELESYGLESKIDKFPMYHSYPKEAELRLLYPEDKIIATEPVCHITSTLPEGIEGELIYIKNGGYEDYKDKDVRGKILLADMTWSPGRPEKARIAYEMGAKGLIIMNWGPKEDNPVIQMGGVKSQWGNPTPEAMKEIPLIPVLSITRKAGEYLKEICINNEDVKVWFKAEATREWVNANQPMGILRAEKKTNEFVIVGSHIDAWGKAAICNSSGNAILLELARIFSKYKDSIKRNIIFAFWDGHEVAECGGSTWFVDNYWYNIVNNCVAYINVDNIAIKGTTIPGIESVSEVQKFLLDIIRETWEGEGKWNYAYKGGGDSSFFGIGVPYISFATEYTEEKLKELNYAFYSPWLHSNEDTIDKIDMDLYKKHFRFFATLLCRVCNLPIIPYSIIDMAEEVNVKLDKLMDIADHEIVKELKPIKDVAMDFKESAKIFSKIKPIDTDCTMLKKYNKILIKVAGKISPAIRSYSGRYGQDPCCYVISEYPIPCLYVPIINILKSKEINSIHEFNLWKTKLLKERNKVYDAINESVSLIKSFVIEYK